LKKFQIEIDNISLGGFAKSYWKSDYATYGNRNQANAMRNMDLRNPNNITPGPSRQRLVNGDTSGVIGTLVLRIMPRAFASSETYGVAGKNILKITPTTVTVDHALNTTELGADAKLTDITEYQDNLYYVCDRSTSTKATIGKRTGASDYDDDYMERSTGSTVGTFSLTVGVPHKLLVGGDDILYITNGNKVSSYDALTNIGTLAAIDLPTDAVITDIEWNSNKILITVDWPNLTGSNRTLQRIFSWDTVSESWDTDTPQVRRSGALFTKEGITFVFYEDVTADGGGRLGYFDGNTIKEICQFKGTLPQFYQVDEKDGFICWVSRVGSEDLIFCWGSGDTGLPARTFQLMRGHHAYIGAIGLPFGSLIVASENGATGGDNIKTNISKEAGYDWDSYFKGMSYGISLDEKNAVIRKLTLDFNQLQVGAETVVSLRNSAGTQLFRGTLSYARIGRKTKKIFMMSKRAEDCRLEINNQTGFSSTTTICLIKKAIISGYSVR
jgi:hypothetical protein